MQRVHGLHHITAMAGKAQENLDFYAGVLGMRLVKRSVNQDDPGTYHLFYADAEGSPGSDLTFFPWAHLAPPRPGHGLAMEVGLRVPHDSLGFWGARLEKYGAKIERVETRFGERVLPVTDPHGLKLALVEAPKDGGNLRFSPWDGSPVPRERQIGGLQGAQLWERNVVLTAQFLTTVLGFEELGSERGWTRFGFRDAAGCVDLRETPEVARGAWGVGSVHHLAWRVRDEQHELAVRAQIETTGLRVTPVIDRFWFKSVYFHEPGGVLFELATDGPGFAVDEDPARLGETLVLPPFLEAQRASIEQALPPLRMPEGYRDAAADRG